MTKQRDRARKARRYKKRRVDRTRTKGAREHRRNARSAKIQEREYENVYEDESVYEYEDDSWASTCTLCRCGPFVRIVETTRYALRFESELDRILEPCMMYAHVKIVQHRGVFDVVAYNYDTPSMDHYEILGIYNYMRKFVDEYLNSYWE